MEEREKADYSTEESGGQEANEKSATKLFHLSNEFFHLVPLKDVDENTLQPIEVRKRRVWGEVWGGTRILLGISMVSNMLNTVEPRYRIFQGADQNYTLKPGFQYCQHVNNYENTPWDQNLFALQAESR